jgi:hypothetical protein
VVCSAGGGAAAAVVPCIALYCEVYCKAYWERLLGTFPARCCPDGCPSGGLVWLWCELGATSGASMRWCLHPPCGCCYDYLNVQVAGFVTLPVSSGHQASVGLYCLCTARVLPVYCWVAWLSTWFDDASVRFPLSPVQGGVGLVCRLAMGGQVQVSGLGVFVWAGGTAAAVLHLPANT